MVLNENPYEVLGVPYGTPLEDCKRAYRTLMRKLHPDVSGYDSSEDSARVTTAYESIRDGKVEPELTVKVTESSGLFAHTSYLSFGFVPFRS